MKKGVDISTKDGKRVVTGLGYYTTDNINDLRELVKRSAKLFNEKVGFKFKDKEGNITGKTYKEFDADIDNLGTALLSLGLKNAHISIISENRYEWGAAFFSIINGTGIAVPLDKYLPKNEIENLTERGKVEAIFYSSAFHDIMTSIAEVNKNVKYYICMETLPAPTAADPRFLTMPELIEKGRTLLAGGDRSFIDAQIDTQKLSILLFTSGTTSMSKGVMLSHSNIANNVVSVANTLKTYENDVHLSLLPLHHTFENTVGLMFMVHSGVCIAYCEGIKYISKNILEYNVSLLVAVPAILEAMYKKVREGIKAQGKDKLINILIAVSSFLLSLGIDLRRVLFKSIFAKVGPCLRLAVSGAAPLDSKVVTWFDKIGLRLVNGYGLTETSPVVAANNDYVNVPGTIGYPLANVEVAIDSPDENGMGEIITRGKNIMLGYYEDAVATKEAISEDGWFRTGDLGTIDAKGFIRITGRAKSMIVLTNGKKAFPEEYEVLLNDIPGVKESYVWGNKASDGDIQVCAKLVIDRENLEGETGALPSEKELAARFGAAIKLINANLPQYKIVRYYIITEDELVKTTTLKIKRNIEYEKVKKALESIGIDMRKASGKWIKT